MMHKIIASFLCMTLLALAACNGQEPQDAAATQAARNEQAAAESARAFDDAVAAGNWNLARAYGDVLLADHPGSAAAQRIASQHADIVAKAEAADEKRRLQALWIYQSIPAGDGQQRSASIHGREAVDVDGSGAKPVQLIFRDHPEWGRSSYLVLRSGDFDCYGGCTVQVTVDEGAPKAMAASRPETEDAIAMFIEDERALWRLVGDAGTIAIEFPVEAGGTRSVVFEVGGLAPPKLPGWD